MNRLIFNMQLEDFPAVPKLSVLEMVLNTFLLGLLWGRVIFLSAATKGYETLEVRQAQGPISVLRGQDFTLECQVVSDTYPAGPAGPVKWFLNQNNTRKLIYSDTGPSDRVTRTKPNDATDFTISIHNFVPEDAGIYYCVKQKSVFSGEEDFRSGCGTEVVERFSQDVFVPIVAGTVCVLLAILISITLYIYIKKKRGKKSCPSRCVDPFPENRSHQVSAGKEDIVYSDVKHSGRAQRARQSRAEEQTTYATIR